MTRSQRIGSILKGITISLVAVFVTIVIVEGLSSAVVFTYEIIFLSNSGLRSRVHVHHDDNLGWVNIPNLHLSEMYGPGGEFTTNSQSFRNSSEIEPEVPEDTRRIICSGDSFTLGIGVRDSDTWCSLLGDQTGWESVNMGEAGYGLGQMYLKYERLAAPLEHNLHIFAFINDSFRRLLLTRFVAWNKPYVTLRDGGLVAENLPVRRRAFFMPWLTYNANSFRRLGTVELGHRVLNRIGPGPGEAPPPQSSLEVAMAIFERIQDLNAEKGSRVLFVFLPENAHGVPGEASLLRDLRDRMEAAGLNYVDLRSEIRDLDYEQRERLFDPEWSHLSTEGNLWVADRIRQREALFFDTPISHLQGRADAATPGRSVAQRNR